MKTNKSIFKRFQVTRGGKVIKRKAGQGHFNSRESGNTTLNKRRDISVSKPTTKTIKKIIST